MRDAQTAAEMSFVRAKIGLVGYVCATGLGNATLDFHRNLPFDRFLVVRHPQLGCDTASLDSRCRVFPLEAAKRDIRQWMRGLDAVFSIETCYFPFLWPLATQMGVRVLLMPNAEWLDPQYLYLDHVDTFIAPTRACRRLLTRLGFGRRSIYVPHPVDTDRFQFRERVIARVFLHCRGWGGYKERKGTDIVYRTAQLCPEVPFIVRAQHRLPNRAPSNVTLLGRCRKPEEQYELGDVALQPSRWEGVGLQILEAMACGIPVIVPDGPPMNEYAADPALAIPSVRSKVMLGERPWMARETDPQSLAHAVTELSGRNISALSRRSRALMEKRSWSRVRPRLLSALGMQL